MAGGSHPKSTTHKPSSSSTPAPHRKSRWESTSSNSNNPPLPQSNQKLPKPNPSPKPNTGRSPKPATPTAGPIQPQQVPPFPFPDLGPPPPPTYGFHMLERRTIMLADGSARSYLALPRITKTSLVLLFHRGSSTGGAPQTFSPVALASLHGALTC
ncbi:hypothetical protein OIU84_018832 [Salix udensis]|uniref:Uncharacterized protein n=1 Tax=Salix udensis TaxID=889485 RepID=A0AAD6KXL6_9ROSI|nr:hypothetical protein OIU84_018832 [Salix udensis]